MFLHCKLAIQNLSEYHIGHALEPFVFGMKNTNFHPTNHLNSLQKAVYIHDLSFRGSGCAVLVCVCGVCRHAVAPRDTGTLPKHGPHTPKLWASPGLVCCSVERCVWTDTSCRLPLPVSHPYRGQMATIISAIMPHI